MDTAAMEECWQRLPDHLLLVHVLPYCSIDVRLAFPEVRPRRLSLSSSHRALLEDCFTRRLDRNSCTTSSKRMRCVIIDLPNGKGYSYAYEFGLPWNEPMYGGIMSISYIIEDSDEEFLEEQDLHLSEDGWLRPGRY